jgi:hypothetical protein
MNTIVKQKKKIASEESISLETALCCVSILSYSAAIILHLQGTDILLAQSKLLLLS